MGALAGCDARRLSRRMVIPCKRPAAESLRFSAYESGVPLAGATLQRARQHSQNVQVIVSRLHIQLSCCYCCRSRRRNRNHRNRNRRRRNPCRNRRRRWPC